MKNITSMFAVAGLLISFSAAAAPTGTPAPDNKKKAAEAPSQATPDKSASDARRDHYPLRGELVSVSPTQVVLKGGKSKPERKFDITSDTKITKDDHPATVKDAKEGQQVTGYVHKTEKGNAQLVSLNLSPKQKDKSADAKTADKKVETVPDKKKKAA